MSEEQMTATFSPRHELAEFLRATRARLEPQQSTSPHGRRRRVKGLRREEVAERAGIGVAWYTWLEQARPINVSPAALARIADALRMQAQERRYLFHLAGMSPPNIVVASTPDLPALDRVVKTLDPSPALLLNACWDVLAWNDAADEVFGSFGARPTWQRNVIWLLFTDPAWQMLHADWSGYARCSLAHFRADSAQSEFSTRFQELTYGLMQASSAFRTWWESREILTPQPRRKTFHHPSKGTLHYDLTVLQVQEANSFKIFVYSRAD